MPWCFIGDLKTIVGVSIAQLIFQWKIFILGVQLVLFTCQLGECILLGPMVEVGTLTHIIY